MFKCVIFKYRDVTEILGTVLLCLHLDILCLHQRDSNKRLFLLEAFGTGFQSDTFLAKEVGGATWSSSQSNTFVDVDGVGCSFGILPTIMSYVTNPNYAI